MVYTHLKVLYYPPPYIKSDFQKKNFSYKSFPCKLFCFVNDLVICCGTFQWRTEAAYQHRSGGLSGAHAPQTPHRHPHIIHMVHTETHVYKNTYA